LVIFWHRLLIQMLGLGKNVPIMGRDANWSAMERADLYAERAALALSLMANGHRAIGTVIGHGMAGTTE
jgi:hypothetical protein